MFFWGGRVVGNTRFISVGQLEPEPAEHFIRDKLPGVSDEDCGRILEAFGGWTHDLDAICSDLLAQEEMTNPASLEQLIAHRMLEQCERVGAAFAAAERAHTAEREEAAEAAQAEEVEAARATLDDDEEDEFLGPLQRRYSLYLLWPSA